MLWVSDPAPLPRGLIRLGMYLDAPTTHLPVSCRDSPKYFLCWKDETVILAWELQPFHLKPSSMIDRPEMETRGTKQPTNLPLLLTENLNTEGKDCVFRNPGMQMSPVSWVNTANLGW